MSTQSQLIVNHTLGQLMQLLSLQLRIKEIETYAVHINVQYAQILSFQITLLDNYPSPPLSNTLNQESKPNNIPIDHSSTFMIQTLKHQATSFEIITIPSPKKQSPSPFRRNRKISKSTNIQQTTDHSFLQLTEPVVTVKQIELQNEIAEVQKELYMKRKLNYDFQEQKRMRLEEILNRKHLELPNKDFSFDFDGEFLFKSKVNLKKPASSAVKAKLQEQQLSNRPKNQLKAQQDQRDILISRGQSQSREAKRSLFANQGKRQVSHLPFIKLNQSSKLSENKRSLSGAEMNKQYTLKSNISRGENSFKHYTEMQKQQTERLYSLKKSQFSQVTEDEVEEKIHQTQTEPQKQSKRMQKYIKKLYEDRNKVFIDKINRSANFDRLNSPQQYTVHRYYKHNFDQDKRNICESSLKSVQPNSRSIYSEAKYE